METKYSADMSWKKQPEDGTQDQVKINLDVSASDAMQYANTEEFAAAYSTNREEHRKNLTKFFAETVIPDLIQNASYQAPQLEGELNTEHKGDISSKWKPEIVNGVHSIHSKIEAVFNLTSDRNLDPLTVINNAKGGIASGLADHVIGSFNSAFLGENKYNDVTDIKIEGDEVTRYSHKDKVA